jgi:tRNA-binding EMAP/Myf-like protein
MVDISLYKVGVVLSIETKSKSGGKPLKACKVDIGDADPITVATVASNVREGSRYGFTPYAHLNCSA